MTEVNYPSKLLEAAVLELSKLPGVGKKTAFRLLMHLLRQDKSRLVSLYTSLQQLSDNIRYCKKCQSISDNEYCNICSSHRDETTICIVEDVNDMMAIECTGQYRGTYHVLNGLISPMEGISPSHLTIKQLEERLKQEPVQEVIFALSSTVEGDTTAHFLYKRLSELNSSIKYTTIAKGISVGNELEYTDEITLARSIKHRLLFG
jgi:recombination protein RecR